MSYRDYAAYLLKFFRPAKPVFVVADASDGSTGPILKVLSGKNLKLKILNGIPDGNFPAHGPDPMKARAEEELSREVKKSGADFGVIFDGDGDRIFFVDDLGRSVNPDAAALLLSKNFKPPFVITPVSGWAWRKALRSKEMRWSPVGHYFIKQKMRAAHAKFAAEPSGHYYFEFTFGKRKAYYDSALRALVEFASQVSALKKNGQKLSTWLDSLPEHYSSGELNFKVKDAGKIVAKIKKVYAKRGKVSALDGVSVEGKGFWFNVRASNTESLLRLNAEANTKKELAVLLGEIKELIKK
ncbi:MAG: Phosphomannomutase [Candidatus Jorgensenbacteria bacterium GW2011_GWA1_48_13]|nr:MAG: Phosphomannomutase [Candidatus Jorgensenbacteria bacterium GW2011_GWA1_48_13]